MSNYKRSNTTKCIAITHAVQMAKLKRISAKILHLQSMSVSIANPKEAEILVTETEENNWDQRSEELETTMQEISDETKIEEQDNNENTLLNEDGLEESESEKVDSLRSGESLMKAI